MPVEAIVAFSVVFLSVLLALFLTRPNLLQAEIDLIVLETAHPDFGMEMHSIAKAVQGELTHPSANPLGEIGSRISVLECVGRLRHDVDRNLYFRTESGTRMLEKLKARRAKRELTQEAVQV